MQQKRTYTPSDQYTHCRPIQPCWPLVTVKPLYGIVPHRGAPASAPAPNDNRQDCHHPVTRGGRVPARQCGSPRKRKQRTDHKKTRQAARDIFILMVDGGFRINEASIMQWSDVDFDNGVIYLYRSKVSNDDFIPMTNRLRTTLLNRQKTVDGEYVFPGRYGGHKTIQNNRALEAAFKRAGLTDVSSHNMRKTFATRLLSRGAAITDVQHLLGHASVKTTEKAYAAFVKNERFKQTIDLLDEPKQPVLKVVK